ncbi:hypothetical protein LOD99_15462 [Oopsacas minuta]|uniref:Syndetin C-terminal domain-containing protein n=1 Tax=Oopsacas minuta TaxID=111878 RepID=A0AAV7KBH6_9METZ|nr:hypothetical protein LOD99_15462 [Oopsacas minuta]
MTLTKWDVKELLSQRNPYVDLIIKEFENTKYIFDKISLTIPIPDLVKTMVIEECCSLMNKLLVEGFACGKKCTHQGRASMLFDFREYVAQIEKNSKLRVPQKSYVEDYIHAFYLDEDEIDKWIQEHKEYSLYQLNALTNCKSTFKRKATNKLLNLIEKGTPPH